MEPEARQSAEDNVEPSSNKPGDVLQEHDSRLHLANHPEDVGPEPPLVVLREPLAGKADGLAREARKDAIHEATPRSAVEGGKVIPDRSRSHACFFHARSQNGSGLHFPLHVADNAHGEPEFEAPDPGT